MACGVCSQAGRWASLPALKGAPASRPGRWTPAGLALSAGGSRRQRAPRDGRSWAAHSPGRSVSRSGACLPSSWLLGSKSCALSGKVVFQRLAVSCSKGYFRQKFCCVCNQKQLKKTKQTEKAQPAKWQDCCVNVLFCCFHVPRVKCRVETAGGAGGYPPPRGVSSTFSVSCWGIGVA